MKGFCSTCTAEGEYARSSAEKPLIRTVGTSGRSRRNRLQRIFPALPTHPLVEHHGLEALGPRAEELERLLAAAGKGTVVAGPLQGAPSEEAHVSLVVRHEDPARRSPRARAPAADPRSWSG